MSRRNKLIAKLRARPSEVDFADIRNVFESFGWRLRSSSGGSHFVFEKSGEFSFSVPTVSGRMVKRTYIVQICELLGLDDN